MSITTKGIPLYITIIIYCLSHNSTIEMKFTNLSSFILLFYVVAFCEYF